MDHIVKYVGFGALKVCRSVRVHAQMGSDDWGHPKVPCDHFLGWSGVEYTITEATKGPTVSVGGKNWERHPKFRKETCPRGNLSTANPARRGSG
jgi:hypothetical protein